MGPDFECIPWSVHLSFVLPFLSKTEEPFHRHHIPKSCQVRSLLMEMDIVYMLSHLALSSHLLGLCNSTD